MSFTSIAIMLLIIGAICYVISKITESLKKQKEEKDAMTTNDVVIEPIKTGTEHPLSERIREYPLTPSEAFEIPLDKYKIGATFEEAKMVYKELEPKPQEADYEGKYPIDEPGINYPKPEKNVAIASIMSSVKQRAEIIKASKTDKGKEIEDKISQLTEEEREMLQQIINKHK